MVSQEIKSEIEKVLNSKCGMMVQWKGIEKILLDAGLAYEQELGPEHFLVHPQNRGGTGINAFNCHSKGAVICSTGADLSQLAGSVAFETNPKTKQKQVSFTASLAKESDGLLANPTGMERFLTVSKGHTSQFCKAIKFNCRTPQASLAGGDGCLGNHLLARDSALATMVNKGWKWTIILACVEETFPQLPSLVESACNSSNATYEAQNEVQLMSAIIAHNISLKQGDKIDFVKVASDLCHGGPLKSYAGGLDGPLVAFLVHMGKQYGENIGDQNRLYGLKAKKYEDTLKNCETFLEYAWNKATQSQIDRSKSYKIFALAAMRAILYLFKKEKHGREGKEYTLAEIETMCNDDLTKGSICSMSTSEPSSSTDASQPDEQAISIHEGKDSMFLAKKALGLEPGTLYTLKDFGNRVWQLQNVTPTYVTLVFTPLLEPSKKMTVKYQAHETMSKMRAYKGKPAKLFEDTEVTSLFPNQESEVLKCQVFQALLEVYNSEDLDVQDIYVQKCPRVAVYAKKNIKIKGVKLIPVPEKISNLVVQEPKATKYGICKFQGTTMYITPPKPLKFPKPEDTNQQVSGMFAPYWACTTKDGDGVLEEKMQSFKSSLGDIEIGILTNTQAIDGHQSLHIYEAPKDEKPDGPVQKKARK
ncbi:unnamed protein product [Cladocopium goreaui]|uniref:Uncharacterized protein n=1 Tax=Cladocopium goreaui TaxID=2562237 RepID=A0A9P1DJA8_9DINO|nr:unnamed protein product [Cladocopium goreaui]CAI4014690.1 unnamed protein product [Cladocopium goreaui]